jgi:dipeptidyl aminopeptidase/acylaminoacyl peptidase
MRPVEIAASDGLTLVSYFTLPVGSDPDGDARPQSPAPLVITPLSAPWMRESYGFNALHQWLANRGYAVLSVNVRGAAGFGKAFLAAGDGEWGARMQADLRDAAQWAIDNGIARSDQIAIVGSGFGGYAAFAGLTFAPDEFRCAASFGGFANLFAYVESAPAPARAALTARVGDPSTSDGRHTLRDGSPIFRVSQIRSPLLMALGARDARAPREEADQIAEAVRARRGGLTYLVFPDEGRALMRPANRLSYLAVLEHFLGDCLGGRVEPVGAAFEGANIQVFDGAVNVPGLSAFARRALPRAVLSRAPPPEPALPPADEPIETAAP